MNDELRLVFDDNLSRSTKISTHQTLIKKNMKIILFMKEFNFFLSLLLKSGRSRIVDFRGSEIYLIGIKRLSKAKKKIISIIFTFFSYCCESRFFFILL